MDASPKAFDVTVKSFSKDFEANSEILKGNFVNYGSLTLFLIQ